MELTITTFSNKAFHYALMFFLGVSTFFYVPVPTDTVLNPVQWNYNMQELFFRYGVIAIVGIGFMIDPIRRIKERNFALFTLYFVALCCMRGFDADSKRFILNIFLALAFFKVVAERFNFYELKKVAWLFFVILLVNLWFTLAQYYGFDPLFTHVDDDIVGRMDRLVGMMKLKVHLGILTVLFIPAFILISPWLMVPAIPLLYFSQSSIAMAAVVSMLGLIAYFKVNKKLFFIVLALLLGVGGWYVVMYDLPQGEFGDRFRVWNFALGRALKSDLFFGSGLGSFAKTGFTLVKGPNEHQLFQWAHNEYLQIFYEGGLAALGIVIAYVVSVFKKFKQGYEDKGMLILFSALLGIGLVSFIQFPFHLGRFVPVMLFWMALYEARYEDLADGAI